MNFPRLKVRPRSTHTVYRFGGLWHSGEAPVGMNNATTMRWEDMRNLSPDKYPMLSTIKDKNYATSIDGNSINQPLIGAADGAHPVFLDELGVLHCNGQSLAVLQQLFPVYGDAWATVYPAVTITFTGSATVSNVEALCTLVYTAAELNAYYLPRRTAIFTWSGSAWVFKGTPQPDPLWMHDVAGITVSGTLAANDKITVELQPYYSLSGYKWLVRMGAFVIEPKAGWYVNVEDLAAGNTMTENDNYGGLNAGQVTDLHEGNVTLTLCQMDGTPYTGAVAQTTPPSSHTSVWIDTSGNSAVAMEWSESYSTWIAIPSTYVKISGIHVAVQSNLDTGVLNTGDGVKFNIYNYSGLDHDVELLLTSSHVLVEAKDTNNGVGYVIVPGTLPAETVTLTSSDVETLILSRGAPPMDYVVEAQNRLWGCRYGVDAVSGELINEIYASKLGDPKNWSVYEGLSTDSWTASRGTPAPFTGAAALSGHPLFFREESVEKVYPSSTGAHQIQTYSIDGVQEGSDRSLVVIDELLYYQSRLGVCVYDGTMPKRIGAAFGVMTYSGGVAARHKKKYVISMLPTGGSNRVTASYDIPTGEWFLESNTWSGVALTWKDELYFSDPANMRLMKAYATSTPATLDWYAESGIIGYELPEHRFISCVQIRLKTAVATGSAFTVKIMYDDSGTWETKATYTGTTKITTTTGSKELNVFPRRCDHFKIRLDGKIGIEILSMSFRMERSEGGH